MTLSLRAAAIASVMAIVASTSVMAQTTGAIPPPVPPSQPSSPPPTANPQKRTLKLSREMSALCQKRTSLKGAGT
jgi:hypothetical protein